MTNIVGNLPPKISGDATTSYFEALPKGTTNVSPAVNDAVIGFFQNFTGSKESGKLLAGTVLYTAAVTGTDPMEIIDEIRRIKSTVKTEILDPVPSDQFTSEYNSYQEVEDAKLDFAPGKIFYIPSTDVFYELDSEFNLVATTNYKAELVTNSQSGETTFYNYYRVSYKFKDNELNAYLTMFLNLNRVGTSLLGINNSPPVSKYVARTILA